MKPFIFTPLLCLFTLALTAQSRFSDQVFAGTAVDFSSAELDRFFSQYEVYAFPTAELDGFIRQEEKNHYEIRLQLGTAHQWDIFLFPNDMRAASYRLMLGEETGVRNLPRTPNATFKGELANEPESEVRLSIRPYLLSGMIQRADGEYFLEPLSYILPGAPAEYLILYRGSDVIREIPFSCGTIAQKQHDDQEAHDPQSNRGSCLEVELALASDFEMYTLNGSDAGMVSDRVLTITNLMEGLYAPFDITYIVVDFYIATSEATDPWTNSLEAFDILASFRTWASNPANINPHDLGQIWTGRDIEGCGGLDSGLIGCAEEIGSVCETNRYNVCEDFSFVTNCLTVLSAHEIGHNFGGTHGASDPSTIMNPTINCAANSWAPGNVTNINNHIATRPCLSACGTACDLSLGVVFTDEACEGANDGSVLATASTSFGPVTFTLSGPVFLSNDDGFFSGLPAGNYTLTASDDDFSMGGCEVSLMLTIGSSFPAPNLMPSSNSPVCEGDDLQLFAGVSGGAPPYSVFWLGPDAFTSGEENPVIQDVTEVATGFYQVSATDANGCVVFAILLIEILDGPEATASNNGPICEFEDLQLTGGAIGGMPPFTFQWTGPNGFVSGMQNPVIANATQAAAGVYSFTVTDANGCIGQANTTVVVHPNPTAAATSNSPVCENDHIFLYANPSGGTPPYSFSWTPLSGANAAKENPRVYDATYDDAGLHTVVVTDANGCTDESGALVVMEPNIDDPGAIAGDEYFCGPGYDPGPIASLEPASGAGPVEYFWIKLTGNSNIWQVIPGATSASYDPGVIYETTVFSRCARKAGCQKSLEANFVTKEVGNESLAHITGPKGVCVGVTSQFSTPLQPGATYLWNFGPGATPQYAYTPTVNVTWSSMGPKTVNLTVATPACTGYHTESVFVSNNPLYCMMGAEEVEERDNQATEAVEPQVFPNPFADELMVQGPGLVSVQVNDVQGRVVSYVPGIDQIRLDLSGVPAGVYLLTIDMGEQGVFRRKVVKE